MLRPLLMYTARACTAKGGFAPCSAALPFHGGGGWCLDLEHRTHRERCCLGGEVGLGDPECWADSFTWEYCCVRSTADYTFRYDAHKYFEDREGSL